MSTVVQGSIATPVSDAVDSDINDTPQLIIAALTATKLVALSPATLARQLVSVQADFANTGTVYVGSINVTDTHCFAALNAGGNVQIPIRDPSKVYVYTIVDNCKVNIGWI